MGRAGYWVLGAFGVVAAGVFLAMLRDIRRYVRISRM
jgi:hypothetical protein